MTPVDPNPGSEPATPDDYQAHPCMHPLDSSQQEMNSEGTESSEQTTAGFVIDTWWSAIREGNKNAVKVRAPDMSSSVQKHQKATSQMMASSPPPTAAAIHHKVIDDANNKALGQGAASSDSITPAAAERAYLPNVWRDTSRDKGASRANSHAPSHPREPLIPSIYDRDDFPMLRPIQYLTDAQIQAIKWWIAEVKKKAGSDTEKGK